MTGLKKALLVCSTAKELVIDPFGLVDQLFLGRIRVKISVECILWLDIYNPRHQSTYGSMYLFGGMHCLVKTLILDEMGIIYTQPQRMVSETLFGR